MTLTVLLYAGVLSFGTFNTVQYLIRQRRYKSLPLLLFYIFSTFTCATRLGRYTAMIIQFVQGQPVYSLSSMLTNTAVAFAQALVGISQVLTMQELSVHIQICLIETEPTGPVD